MSSGCGKQLSGPLLRKVTIQGDRFMPLIGWVFLLLAIALVVGSLLMLRDSANKFPISDEKMRKIQARKAEVEAEESAEDREN
tara:strand:+ start:356 stop:604 length:249 start_codon:yes stop_codon:yes gene_type:complete